MACSECETNMTLQYIDYHVLPSGLAHVILNRPDKRNAFDENMIAELTQCFTQANDDHQVKVVQLSAKGPHFCAGADLNWMRRMTAYSGEQNKADAKQLALMLNTLYTLRKPTIARVQGNVMGGAGGLVACCDIVIAANDARFCFSEVKLGLVPATIAPYVVKAIGERAAKRYFQTAEMFSAIKALELGLVSEVINAEQVDTVANTITSHILNSCPIAVCEAKTLVSTVANRPIDDSLMTLTSDWIAKIRVSESGQEGLSAFFEKRSPNWCKELKSDN